MALALFTIAVNLTVDYVASGKVYEDVASVPHNRVGLLLGTSPLTRARRTNHYFMSRILTAVSLFEAGKIDYIIASGDNRTMQYNEPIAMRDSLVAHGVPLDRIVLDYAGFRTLDSVVRAKEVFGCDTLTIISQDYHCARALCIAASRSIKAVAVAAPSAFGWRVRLRMTLREWLARDKMVYDILTGVQPRFLGDKIII